MSPASSLPTSPRARGSGTELWLLRAESAHASALAAFAGCSATCVLAPPDGEEAAWAEAFASTRGLAWSPVPELARARVGESPAAIGERAWSACERALSGASGPVLVLLEERVLQLLVARALGYAPERADALRVDPGHAVLLRDDPIGIVLRHSNVAAPPARSGTALPGAGAR